MTVIPSKVLKHFRKGKPLDKFDDIVYEDKNLCGIACLKEYIFRQNKHEGFTTDQLIITLRKSFKGTSVDTMSRWI